MEALKTYVIEKTLRERMLETLSALKMTKQEAAMRMNYSRPALSKYLSGKYTSNPTEIEKKIEEFLKEAGDYLYRLTNGSGSAAPDLNAALAESNDKHVPSVREMIARDRQEQEAQERKPLVALKPIRAKLQYFESRDYVQVIGVCQACQENKGLGIVVGKSGYGKTHALRKYAELQRVIYIEGNETMNCKDIIRRIENKIGAPRSYGSIDERMERIVEFFNINQGYLLIMDEADKLINKYTQKKIELLRNIADGSQLGIVIAGEPVLETLLKGYDVRFANRMDFYYKMRGLLKKEVEDYLEGYEIEEKALYEFVARANNNQSGCFRLLDRTLGNVIRILKERGQDKVTMKIMSEASSMMML